jgi:hypothetical protein
MFLNRGTAGAKQMSPLVVEEKGYGVYVLTDDHTPAHVHVFKDRKVAKFSLDPVELMDNNGFTLKMIMEARDIIRRHKGHCWAIWHQVHGTGDE